MGVPGRHVEHLADPVVGGLRENLEPVEERVEHRTADPRVERGKVLEPQPLPVEHVECDRGLGVGEHALDLGLVAVLGQQVPAARSVDQLVVGRRLPKVVGESLGQLPPAEPEHPRLVGHLVGAMLDEIHELRRGEHDGDDVGERLRLGALGDAVGIEHVAVERHLVVFEGPPKRPLAEAADEVVDAGVVIRRVAVGGTGPRNRLEVVGRQALGDGRRHVVAGVDVLLVDVLVEASESTPDLAGQRAPSVLGHALDQGLDVGVDLLARVAHGPHHQVVDRVLVLDAAEPTQRQRLDRRVRAAVERTVGVGSVTTAGVAVGATGGPTVALAVGAAAAPARIEPRVAPQHQAQPDPSPDLPESPHPHRPRYAPAGTRVNPIAGFLPPTLRLPAA